jgi:hypothetical protein
MSMNIWDYHINDEIEQIEGFKRGRKGIVVEIPYDEEKGGNQLGVLWDDNHAIGIQAVLPTVVKKVE